jgi:uncharacterized protein YegP (UPF0339 family)
VAPGARRVLASTGGMSKAATRNGIEPVQNNAAGAEVDDRTYD